MAQLTLRNLEDELVQALKTRAAQHGRSVEAEHREILREALLGSRPRRSFKQVLATMPDVGDDADFSRVPDRGHDDAL